MLSENDKVRLLNASMDLERAARLMVTNPSGSTHQIFLSHAEALLKGVTTAQTKPACAGRAVLDLGKNEGEIGKRADRVLTAALILRGRSFMATPA